MSRRAWFGAYHSSAPSDFLSFVKNHRDALFFRVFFVFSFPRSSISLSSVFTIRAAFKAFFDFKYKKRLLLHPRTDTIKVLLFHYDTGNIKNCRVWRHRKRAFRKKPLLKNPTNHQINKKIYDLSTNLGHDSHALATPFYLLSVYRKFFEMSRNSLFNFPHDNLQLYSCSPSHSNIF